MTVTDRLRQLLAARIAVLDGAIGTMPAGMGDDDIHAAYLAAGADIITTNTFQAATYEDNAAAARLARWAVHTAAAGRPAAFVAGVIGPARGSFDALLERCRIQVRGLIDGGVDLLLVETIMNTTQVIAASAAIREELDERGLSLPVMFSATVDRQGLLLSGETLEAFAAAATGAQAFAVGLNCAHGARDIAAHIRRLADVTMGYTSCHPSAGLPDAAGRYPEAAAEVAGVLRQLAADGVVNIVGGCCGTTPEYTRAMAGAVGEVPARAVRTVREGSRSSPSDPS
jgi:5-methyltetrahydrofolate--homocysteine methyltransferase